ncbi:MAG: Flp pilus assembly complex ATPase component TadA [Candidatus Omnitrophota bacterium]|nr:MAG: Flp pilus assembly complex ATPase component TadA [Candidatus Omnitrophota bacterium]
MPQTLKQRITNTLLEKKLLSKKRLDEALKVQRERGGKLSQILVNLGYVKEQDLVSALSQNLNIPAISLEKYRIDPSVTELVPKEIARRYEIIPISKIKKSLTIAMADPLNVFAIDDIASLTGFQVRVVIATAKEILDAIEQYYAAHTRKAIEAVVKVMEKPESITTEVVGAKQLTVSELRQMVEEVPVVKVTNMILAEAIGLKASDVLIEPLEDVTRIRYRIDGLLQKARTLPKRMHDAVISRIKVMSELNIAEHRLPQDGRFKIKFKDRFVDFRIAILPSSYGEKAGLRILDKAQATLDIEKLGFKGRPLEELKKAAMRPHGMILVCGPTGCGKTTSLYSILKYIETPEKNMLTVEDPVEFDLPGINQVNARPETGLTFAATLRSMLRQDPDIIMVGEIRDYETADIAIKAALTGHLVLSTLHTNTAAGAITRAVNMGIEPFLISSSVILIAAQRLVRKICTKCKEHYKINDSIRKEFNLSKGAKDKFYKGGGCDFCLDTGYKGRIGIIEVIALTPTIRALVMDKASESEIKEQARKEGMITLREDGLNKAKAGITTLEEVTRVTMADKG